jgi:hypothetical protein
MIVYQEERIVALEMLREMALIPFIDRRHNATGIVGIQPQITREWDEVIESSVQSDRDVVVSTCSRLTQSVDSPLCGHNRGG